MRGYTLNSFCTLLARDLMINVAVAYLADSPTNLKSPMNHTCCGATKDEASVTTICRITSIAAGLNHNAAMSVAGEIYMWGSNKHGCLGLGDTTNRVLPTKVQGSVSFLSNLCCLLGVIQAGCAELLEQFLAPDEGAALPVTLRSSGLALG